MHGKLLMNRQMYYNAVAISGPTTTAFPSYISPQISPTDISLSDTFRVVYRPILHSQRHYCILLTLRRYFITQLEFHPLYVTHKRRPYATCH